MFGDWIGWEVVIENGDNQVKMFVFKLVKRLTPFMLFIILHFILKLETLAMFNQYVFKWHIY
jgi:hypothetical protein